ncbi:MAG: carbonic anhydrase [Caulobacteraceae bacterium]|nr:carbonic anhydrase [Caulobacteraceae bacterium]
MVGLRPCSCSACESGPAVLHRRGFLGAGAFATVAGVVPLLAPWSARAKTSLSPDAAVARLMAGNERFVRGQLDSPKENLDARRKATVEGQEPFAAVLSCADSRVPVELVFDEGIGQLFVTRVAGNIVTPEILASLEYGVGVLGTRAILVLAHQGCGAVHAAIDGKAVPGQISALYAPLRQAVARGGGEQEAVAKANAQIQAGILAAASPVLASAVKEGALKVVAAYYALDTGKVTLLA